MRAVLTPSTPNTTSVDDVIAPSKASKGRIEMYGNKLETLHRNLTGEKTRQMASDQRPEASLALSWGNPRGEAKTANGRFSVERLLLTVWRNLIEILNSIIELGTAQVMHNPPNVICDPAKPAQRVQLANRRIGIQLSRRSIFNQ